MSGCSSCQNLPRLFATRALALFLGDAVAEPRDPEERPTGAPGVPAAPQTGRQTTENTIQPRVFSIECCPLQTAGQPSIAPPHLHTQPTRPRKAGWTDCPAPLLFRSMRTYWKTQEWQSSLDFTLLSPSQPNKFIPPLTGTAPRATTLVSSSQAVPQLGHPRQDPYPIRL
jgi:hypothetical protein